MSSLYFLKALLFLQWAGWVFTSSLLHRYSFFGISVKNIFLLTTEIIKINEFDHLTSRAFCICRPPQHNVWTYMNISHGTGIPTNKHKVFGYFSKILTNIFTTQYVHTSSFLLSSRLFLNMRKTKKFFSYRNIWSRKERKTDRRDYGSSPVLKGFMR